MNRVIIVFIISLLFGLVTQAKSPLDEIIETYTVVRPYDKHLIEQLDSIITIHRHYKGIYKRYRCYPFLRDFKQCNTDGSIEFAMDIDLLCPVGDVVYVNNLATYNFYWPRKNSGVAKKLFYRTKRKHTIKFGWSWPWSSTNWILKYRDGQIYIIRHYEHPGDDVPDEPCDCLNGKFPFDE